MGVATGKGTVTGLDNAVGAAVVSAEESWLGSSEMDATEAWRRSEAVATLLDEGAGATVSPLPVSVPLPTPVSTGAAGSVAASSYGSGPSTVRCDVEDDVSKTVAAEAVFVDVSRTPPSAAGAGAGIAVDDAGEGCMSPGDIRDDVTVPVKEDWTVALP
ncbi:UNVERIFIED_ORG: hypothetical protein GGD47_001607 [Rhizobium etli]